MKKGFTLTEVIIATVVVAILVSIAIVSYRQFVDIARQKVCEINLLILETAVREQAIEEGALPATLGDLRPEKLYKAYAGIMNDRDWFTKFCFFFEKSNRPKVAYAKIQNLRDLMIPAKMREYGVEPDVFVCPASGYTVPEVEAGEKVCYGINKELQGKKWEGVHKDRIIVADCDKYVFENKNDFAYRHIRWFGLKKIAQVVRKGGRVQRGGIDDDETDDPHEDDNGSQHLGGSHTFH